MTEQREHTVRFPHPWTPPPEYATAGGLELLSAIARGDFDLPPYGVLLGMEVDEVEDGRVVFGLDPGPHLLQGMHTMHGGAVSSLLDSAMSCAVQTTISGEGGHGYSTIDLTVHFVRGVTTESGRVRAEGVLVHRGRRLATAEGRLFDAAGRLCAHGTTTVLIAGG